MTFVPRHVLQPSGHRLPLRWLRLPLWLATLGLSCVCIAVGAQALDKSSKLETQIRELANATGSSITFNMNDIRATSIVLTTVGSLLALTSLIFSILLGFDWIHHLLRPPQYSSKEDTSVKFLENNSPLPPISTRTLPFQTIALSFLTVWLLSVLIPSTLFSRTRSAHVTIRNGDRAVLLDPVYWDYGFLRCLAAAPWFAFIFALPTSVVTFVAWKYSALPSSSTKTLEER